jgi:8-oxo-dGTP pyrophosphatase MutT (NUDIX family)
MPISDYLRRIRRLVGHDLLLLPSVTAVVFNEQNQVLLQHNADAHRWCLIGGAMDPGEQPAECAIREVKEEAGIDVTVRRLIGVHTRPLVSYPNGDKVLYVSTSFLCAAAAGEPRICDDESLDMRYFAVSEMPRLIDIDQQLIAIAISNDPAAHFDLPRG